MILKEASQSAHLSRNEVLTVIAITSKLQNQKKNIQHQFNSFSPLAPCVLGQRTIVSSEENSYN